MFKKKPVGIKRMQIVLEGLVSSTQQLERQLKEKLSEKLEASIHGKTKNQLDNAIKLAKTIKLLISHATYKLYQAGLKGFVPLDRLLAPHVPAELSEKIMHLHSMNFIADLKSSLEYPIAGVVDEIEIEFQTIIFRALRCIIRFDIVPSDMIDDPFDKRFPCIIGHHIANRIRMTQETYEDFEAIVRKPISEILLEKNLLYISEESSGYHDLQNLIRF